MSSARSLASNGYTMGSSYPGLGFSPQFQGGWYLNSALGMYTYMPYGGLLYNPFGYGFYSPGLIDSYYSPYGYYWYGGGGARTGSTVGQPLANLSGFSGRSTAVTGSQISRLGTAGSVHPTLGSPLRGSTTSLGSASRAEGGLASRGGNIAASSSASSGGGFSGGGSSGGGGGISAASAGGGSRMSGGNAGGGGTRSR